MPHTARYVYSFAEYKLLHSAVRRQTSFSPSPFMRWIIGGLLFLALFNSLSPALQPTHRPVAEVARELVENLLPLVLIFGAMLLLVRSSLYQRLLYRQCPLAGQTVTYELGARGVSWMKEGTHVEFEWPAFKSVTVTPAAAVLLIGRIEGIVLPVRAFASQEEFEEAAKIVLANAPAEKPAQAAELDRMSEGGSAPYTARHVFSLEDYSTLLATVRSQSRYGFWLPRLIFVAVALLIVGFPYLQDALAGNSALVPSGWNLVANFLPLAFMYAVFELTIFRSSFIARLSFKQCSNANQELSYELGEKGLSWTREDGIRGDFDWPAIEAVIIKPAAAVLLIGKRQGLVLPARAFSSRGEFEAAMRFARARIHPETGAAGA